MTRNTIARNLTDDEIKQLWDLAVIVFKTLNKKFPVGMPEFLEDLDWYVARVLSTELFDRLAEKTETKSN